MGISDNGINIEMNIKYPKMEESKYDKVKRMSNKFIIHCIRVCAKSINNVTPWSQIKKIKYLLSIYCIKIYNEYNWMILMKF